MLIVSGTGLDLLIVKLQVRLGFTVQ